MGDLVTCMGEREISAMSGGLLVGVYVHLDDQCFIYLLLWIKCCYCFPGSLWCVKWLGRAWCFSRSNDTHNNETMVWPGERNCKDTHWSSDSLRIIQQWWCRSISHGYLDNWTMDSFQPSMMFCKTVNKTYKYNQEVGFHFG